METLHTYIEKQGEQPYGRRQECVDCQFNYAGECKGSCAMKRNEQKPADKVKPKFKIGDLVKYTNHNKQPIYKVNYIDKECYICTSDDATLGDKAVMHFAFDNPYLRLVEQKSVDKVESKFNNHKNCKIVKKMRHKQRIQIGRNVTNIIKLPCVRAVEKQADGTLFYLLYGGQIARQGNWLVESITGKWYVLPDEKKRYVPKCVKTEFVDGERIKADTWYKLVDGEFVEQ